MQAQTVDVGVVEIPLVQRKISDLSRKDCKIVADSLEATGLIKAEMTDGFDAEAVLHRPRRLIDAYTDQTDEEMREDEYPQDGHEVGLRPRGTEKSHPNKDVIARMRPEHQPVSARYAVPPPDCKLRIFEPIMPESRSIVTTHPQLNRRRSVVPRRFPEWANILRVPGLVQYDCTITLLTMAAIGFGEEPELFTAGLYGGPHLFGPTICHPLDVLQAYLHRDIGKFSCHLQPTHRGARFLTRDLFPFTTPLKENQILGQAADQLEAETGGVVVAGFHEVAAPEDPGFREEVLAWEKQHGKKAKRIAFPGFFHNRSSFRTGPLGRFATPQALANPEWSFRLAGDKVWSELDATSTIGFKH